MNTTSRHTARATAALCLSVAGVAAGVLGTTSGSAQAADTVGATTQVRVTSSTALKQRSKPTTYAPVGGPSLARGTLVDIDCSMPGTSVDGNATWYKLADSRSWVSARYVTSVGARPVSCTASGAPAGSSRATADVNIRQGPTVSDRRVAGASRGSAVTVYC